MIWLSVFGSVSFAFQSGRWALVARFSLLGGDRSFLRLRRGWAIIFRRICADREWIVNMADEGKENRTLSFHPQYSTVCYHYIGNYIPQSLPVEGGWLRPAARERSSHVLDGTNLVRKRTCTNEIHPQSPYKSFAELFQKRPFPSSPLVPHTPR